MASFGPGDGARGLRASATATSSSAERPPLVRREAAGEDGKPWSNSRRKTAKRKARPLARAGRRSGDHAADQAAVRSGNSYSTVDDSTVVSEIAPDRPQAGRSGPLRALRPVPERLPHLSRAGPGDGFAARTHPPDGAGGRGRAHHARPTSNTSSCAWPAAAAKRLPFGRALRPAGGSRARRNRNAPRSARGRRAWCAASSSASCCVRRRC